MYKVSVCVPIYKVAAYIERCARSLFEQSLDDIEYIFVDDGSPDDSVDILNRVLCDYPNRQEHTTIIRLEKNEGPSHARKVAINHTHGEYVIACDSDDWVESHMYETMYATAKREQADIVCCGIIYEKSDGAVPSLYPYLSEAKDMVADVRYVEGGLYSAVWNKLVKRELYDSVVWHLEFSMWDDLYVTLQLRMNSSKTVVVNTPLYHYNCMNIGSICSFQTDMAKMKDKVLAAGYIDAFFRTFGADIYKKYEVMISYLKFISKCTLLNNPTRENIRLWLDTYPESHKYIWQYHNYSLRKRIECYFKYIIPSVFR